MAEADEFVEIRSVLEKYNSTLELNKKKEAEFDQYKNDFVKVVKNIIEPTMNEIKDCVKELGHDCTINFDLKGEQSLDGSNLPLIEFSMISPSPQRYPLSTYNTKISFYATVRKKVGIDTCVIPSFFGKESSEFDLPLWKITKEFVREKITQMIKEYYGKN